MKIFLDLEKKTVQIIDLIGFDELEELKRFLGDDYKSWKIEPTADAPEKEYVPIPSTFPGTGTFPGTFPQQPFQPYNPFPVITYGPNIGTAVGTGGYGITTGSGITSGNTSTNIGAYATYTSGNLAVFNHATDNNKIFAIGDFSSTTLTEILKDKIEIEKPEQE